MTDRDDALRNEPGWTGPGDRDAEPAHHEPAPHHEGAPPRPPVPPRPPAGAHPQLFEAERPGNSFRQPVHGAPPGRPGGWGPAPGPQTWTPPTAPIQPGQPAPMFAGTPQPPAPPQPNSYAELIRADDLVPTRKPTPGRGWRRALYTATFGLINLGPSPEERRIAELEKTIRGPLRGHFKVGVMGKGGVGKTTVSASIGSMLAELRQDDRVIAVDAATAFGKLGSRVDPRAQGSFWELTADQHLETFADIRNRVGSNAAGLFVLAGEATPARRRVLDPAIYREAAARLDRHFSISVIDCSSTMDSPVTQEVLRDLDALVVVSSPWVDGAAAAGQTLDWLSARGMTGLLRRTVVVLNDSDGHADKRTKSTLAQQFSSQGQRVIEVPFDGHLRPGGVIDGTSEMSRPTRTRLLEVCAALAEHFPRQDDRTRDRR